MVVFAANFENHFHVVSGALTAAVFILLRRHRNEVVVLAGPELEAARLRRERPERDCEVSILERRITNCNRSRLMRVRYPTRVVLLFRHLTGTMGLISHGESC